MHIVAVGASAGGLEALEAFFGAVPHDNEAAFLVVQHLPPDHKTMMVELLSRHTPLRVVLAEDGAVIDANTVYLMPPGKHLGVDATRLRLTPRPQGPVDHPIDVLFSAVAHACGDRAAAVVLSGTGTDGTQGVAAIREAGGVVAVQEPSSARFDGMPRSALAATDADVVDVPEALAGRVLHLLQTQTQVNHTDERDRLVAEILAELRRRLSIDFSEYKKNTVIRRINRRMQAAQVSSLAGYHELLTEDVSEVEALGREMLISVTRFLRDVDEFDALRRLAINDIVQAAPHRSVVRAWVPGCATGEEAYSVAMLFLDHPEWDERGLELKVFASDIDREALEWASAGIYPVSAAVDLGENVRHFTRVEGGLRVSSRLRRSVIFSYHNVAKDTPFSRMDLVTFRNVLIYFEPSLQARVMSSLNFALRDRGWLFLGNSEAPPDAAQFDAVDQRARLFRRLPGPRHLAHGIEQARAVLAPRREQLGANAVLVNLAREELLSRHQSAAFVVGPTGLLLHAFGKANDYIKLPQGTPSLVLHELLPRQLGALLSLSLSRALRDQAAVSYRDIEVDTPTARRLNVDIVPLADHRSALRGALVEIVELKERELDEPRPSSVSLRQIENELQSTRENLQAVVEQLETANEELQATNEEYVASNEELQSTNEEMQSVNEELVAVNAEFRMKIDELRTLTADVDQMLEATAISTLFLETDLRIRRYSVGRVPLLHLLPSDVGRPLTDLAAADGELLRAVGIVASTGQASDSTVEFEGHAYLVRVRRHDEGIVVTFIDVTRLRDAERRLQGVIDALPDETIVVDADGHITMANRRWTDFAVANGGALDHCGPGANYLDVCRTSLATGDPTAGDVAEGLRQVLRGEREYFALEYPCEGPQGPRWFRLHAVRLPHGGAVVSHVDLTQARLQLQQAEREHAQLKAVFEAMPDPVLLIATHDVVADNAAARAFFGRSSIGPVSAAFSLAPELLEMRTGSCRLNARTSRGDIGVECRLADAGTVRVLTLRDDDQALQRQEQSDKLVQARTLESLGRFAGGVAHDINNLLAQIVGLTEVIKDTPAVPDVVRDDLNLIVSSSEHGASMIRNLLAFARGQPAVARQAQLLSTTIAGTVALVSRTDARLRQSIEGDGVVVVDPSAVSQAVLNLLRNALDPSVGATEVLVRLSSSSTHATIEVRDNGRGMTDHVKRHAFDPFFTTRDGGSGLGLSSAYGAIREHGGDITVESHEGQGTSLRISLPLQPVVPAEKPLLLLVDDEPIITRSVQRWMNRAFTVQTFNDPLLALEAIKAGLRPHVALFDVAMPGLSGVHLLREVELVMGELPVVFITGYARVDIPPSVLQRSTTQLVEKPFRLDALLETVELVLQTATAAAAAHA